MAGISSRLAKLNPFGDQKSSADSDDVGETLDMNSMAGGGHAARETEVTRQLRVSSALRSFLIRENVLSERDAGLDVPDTLTDQLRAILDKPHIQVPIELTDRSHTLPSYFISSSHNTYLMAHQLYGSSSADAYKATLKAGARCVEIDAWNGDNKEEPKVTHGWTLASNIPFRVVCEAIRDVVDEEEHVRNIAPGWQAAPILISLENHCDARGQLRLVEIMREVLGDRLLSKAIREKGSEEQQGTGEHVTLDELGSKVAVIVEYQIPGEMQSDDDEVTDNENEETKRAKQEYEEQGKQTAPAAVIIPELAELGVYAQSVKPPNNAWFEVGVLQRSPHHPLINVSEVGLAEHMPAHNANITDHNAEHLMRVYPKGTRINSDNLNPVKYWGIGAQICALNWQTFGASLQLNEALFSGTDGYVLKPKALRQSGTLAINYRKRKLRLHVAGASDVPLSTGHKTRDDLKPYLTCSLVHPTEADMKKKTQPYKQHKLAFMHKEDNPPPSDPVWDEVLEWEYPDNELVFLRLLIKSDDAFAKNPILCVSAVRVLYVQPGWVFIRMLDLKGHETKCCLLVKFETTDVHEHV